LTRSTESPPAQTEVGSSATESNGKRWQIFLVASAALYGPLTTWANAGESPVLGTLLLAAALLVGIGVLIWFALTRLGIDGLGAAYTVMLFQLAVTNAGSMVGKYHPLDRLALLLLAILAGVLAYRLRELGAFRLLMTWAAIFLIAYPTVLIASQRVGSGGTVANVEVGTEITVAGMSQKPDVLMVVFDGYGSTEVLDEFYGFDNSEVLDELGDSGFYAPGSITANYARTQLSIPSVLQMGYVTQGTTISNAAIDALGRVITGESRMVEAFKSEGYRHIYVESGWLGSRCSGSTIDVCIAAPWPDETFFDVSYRTILRGLPGFELGRSFTEGVLNSADWLMNDLNSYLDDDTPDFIFAHLLLPHPPLFLHGDCAPDWRNGQPGFAIGRREFDDALDERARQGYLEQVLCANTIALEIARSLAPETAAIFIGDHGPDGQGQLFVPSAEWDGAQRQERFGTFFAARVPGCDMTGTESLVNVGRRALSCLAGADLPDLPLHTYDLIRAPGGNAVAELDVPGW
jgi:hypothetical protein